MNSAEPAGRNVPDDNSSGQRFVTFDIGKNYYCLPADDVSEISHPLPITKLPRVSTQIAGIAPLRGEILAVVDLRQLLGEERSAPTSKTKFVVLGSSGPECQIALPVDRIRDVAVIAPESVSDPKEGQVLVAGVAKTTSRTLNILDTGRIRVAFAEQKV
ncbi:MAG TPA: chemotaxis protein CheW [Pyrinomonadaceae bacterium]|nr:chemotaxis protein CheW [Pyrinomonadaceae bacterium]HMP66411.1 chemotaxis protein CheW [Pyrinomonadaceae bacterium]